MPSSRFSAVLAATAALLYFAVDALWMVVAVSLFQAAALAPLVPLADALSLAHARVGRKGKPGAFEYGWVRGAGSAAFVAGILLAGQVAGTYGLSAVIWLSAGCLLAASIAAILVPEFPAGPAERPDAGSARVHWLALFRLRAFVRVVVVAALVLGSHAMYDAFAVIRWTGAGISPATTASLWSESVAAEVVVFLFIGPRLLGVLNPAGALALAAVCGFVRWGVMAQTADVAALALVQPLHGFTFALLHLACMRVIADTVPRELGRNSAGCLWPRRGRRRHRRFDGLVRMAFCAFRTERVLGNGRALHSCFTCRRLVARAAKGQEAKAHQAW